MVKLGYTHQFIFRLSELNMFSEFNIKFLLMVTIVFLIAYRKKEVYEEPIGNSLVDDTNPLYR